MQGLRRYGTAALVCISLSTLLLAGQRQPIGFATSASKFTVGSSVVKGQATLFEGDQITTLYLSTRLQLKDGSKYRFGIDSGGTIHQDHVSLQFGSVEMGNGVRPSRVLVSSLNVVANKPSSEATVYFTGKNQAAVLVRSGDVSVSQAGSPVTRTIGPGQLVSLKLGAKGAIQTDSDGAVTEVTRVQSEQLESLIASARDLTCLEPAARELSRSFANLSSQVVSTQAARSALQAKVEAGMATPSDLRNVTVLTDRMKNLNEASASFASSMDDAVYQFHHPIGPFDPFISPHTVHGHLNLYIHHGQHGHTIPGPYPNGPYGHHQVPPHLPG